jgi:hypothetical protein
LKKVLLREKVEYRAITKEVKESEKAIETVKEELRTNSEN